jgi:hypothetical protein
MFTFMVQLLTTTSKFLHDNHVDAVKIHVLAQKKKYSSGSPKEKKNKRGLLLVFQKQLYIYVKILFFYPPSNET